MPLPDCNACRLAGVALTLTLPNAYQVWADATHPKGTMNDINELAPSSLTHLIGMPGVTAQVAVGIEAAFADNKKFDDALLTGPPGTGKTQTAKVIASEMATTCHEVLGQAVECSADLNALLLTAQDRDVVFVDEAHELRKEIQTALYLAIDKRQIIINGGRSGNAIQCIPIANFTLLLATTDEYCLLQPLRDRMKLTLRFSFYEHEALVTLTRQRCRGLGWVVSDEVFPLIAMRSRGTPRIALRLLQAARRVCRAEGETSITLEHLERACLLESIDRLGLGTTEQQYLGIVKEGATRLNVVASRLGLPSRTVSQVTEPLLLRLGLVTKDEQGRRQLTAAGFEHLHQHQQQGV
jgi:Holliday junction DNA helicase RuvB